MTWSVWQFFSVVVKSDHGCWLRCPSCTARDQRVGAGAAAAAQWLRKALRFMRKSGECLSLGGKVWREAEKVLGRHQTGEAEQKHTVRFFHIPSKDARMLNQWKTLTRMEWKAKFLFPFQKKTNKKPNLTVSFSSLLQHRAGGNTLHKGYQLVQAAFILITHTHTSFSPMNRMIPGTSPKSSPFHPQTPKIWQIGNLLGKL